MDDSDAEEEEDELEFEDDDDEEEEEDAARLYLEYGLDPTTATPKDLLAAMDQRTRDDTAAREVALELERCVCACVLASMRACRRGGGVMP